MRGSKKIQAFTDRYPLVGPVFWLVNIQYFIVMLVVALAWTTRYSVSQNAISDLGNTACGTFSGRYVCSPLHGWMNASFITLGLTWIIGSVLIYHEFRKSLGTTVGFSFMGLAGIGTILVGLFPENAASGLHELGASVAFVLGNLALIVLGLSLDISRAFRYYTLISGVVSLLAFVLLISQQYLGLGLGGMERLVSYPQTIWLIAFGIYMSKKRFIEVLL